MKVRPDPLAVDVRALAASGLWNELTARLETLAPDVLDGIEASVARSLVGDADPQSRALKHSLLRLVAEARKR